MPTFMCNKRVNRRIVPCSIINNVAEHFEDEGDDDNDDNNDEDDDDDANRW